jgi:hypothetical protein
MTISLDAALFESGPYRALRFDNPTTTAAILAQAQAHKTYTYRDYDFKSLPRYDNLTAHAEVNDDEEESRVKAEIERIVKHIQEHDLQESLLPLEDQLGSTTSQAALEDIAIVVDRITSNLDLCVFDMANTIIRELAPHRRSSRIVDLVTESAIIKARKSSLILIRDYVGSDTVIPRRPRQLQIAHDESKLYLTLLEYFTALLGRFLVNSAEGSLWVHKCLGILARMTAKLRLLGYDATTHAERSVRGAEDIISSLEYDQEVEKQSGGKPEALRYGRRPATSSSIETYADLVDAMAPSIIYHMEQMRIRSHLTGIMKRLLDGFSQRKQVSRCTPFSFELNTIIRASKSVGENDEVPSWLISDDRHKSIDISDQSTLLRICYPGCQLLLYNLLAIRKRDAQQPQPSISSESRDSSENTGATLDWSFKCESEGITGFSDGAEKVMSSTQSAFLHQGIYSPGDYISILAPLLLGSSAIAKETFQLITVVQSFRGTEKGIKLYRQGHFEAMFTFRCLVGQADNDPPESDAIGLSSFRNIGFHSDPRGVDGDTSGIGKAGSKFDYKRFLRPSSSASDVEMADLTLPTQPKDFLGIQAAESLYNKYEKSMKSWKITDKTVVVHCNTFVFSAIGLFLAIVIIGLAILFKFGKKLAGVDRSNILIFLWTIAVFGIGLSKNWYTKDWSWHDFIHRQLPCKSVQELRRVTGVDEQVLMMYLLRNDHKQFYTTGEYNSLFQRRAKRRGKENNSRLSKNDLESVDGFSIDCPLKLSTLLACGFLVFMVGSEDGVHLICIGGKKRNESIQCDSSTKVLVCKAPRLMDQEKEKVELYFEEKDFSWERSYGLYANANMYFG